MNIHDEIRAKTQQSVHSVCTSELLALKHMTFSDYDMADDEIWNEIISPMLRFAIELKVWGEIGQYEFSYLELPRLS